MRQLRSAAILLALSCFIVIGEHALAQQGGCVFAESAAIYASSTGDKVEFTASKGACVAGVNGFEKKGDRVHVMYFPKPEQKGIERTAWMVPSDLTIFDYECTCDEKGKCRPLLDHFASSEWNDCFKTGRDKLLAQGAAPPGGPTGGPKALTNDDVITLTKAGLGDDIVLSKVTSAPAVKFDTSVDELIRLKKEGVGKSVIEAMVKQPEKAVSSSSGPASTKLRSVSAAQVRVTSSSDATKGCKALGNVHASIDTFFGGGSGTVTKRLQELAASRGANVVLLMGAFTTVKKTNGSEMMGDGEAFACPE